MEEWLECRQDRKNLGEVLGNKGVKVDAWVVWEDIADDCNREVEIQSLLVMVVDVDGVVVGEDDVGVVVDIEVDIVVVDSAVCVLFVEGKECLCKVRHYSFTMTK